MTASRGRCLSICIRFAFLPLSPSLPPYLWTSSVMPCFCRYSRMKAFSEGSTRWSTST